MADLDNSAVVSCHSYTHARRFPIVIGKIGGFVLPTPLSPSQIATLIGSFFVMLATRSLWGMVLPGMADALVLMLLPGVLTWAVRHLRMEGRAPLKMLFGLISLAAAPTHGTTRGRQSWSEPRPSRAHQRIFSTGPDPAATTAGTPQHLTGLGSEPLRLRVAAVDVVGDEQPAGDRVQLRSEPVTPWASLAEAA